MTVVETTSPTDRFAQAVRAACDDLPPATKDELLEDLDEHLADVAAELEGDETLTDRLGSPEAYAADLRQSAGVSAPGVAPRSPFGRRLRALWASSEEHPQGQVARRHLEELRPAWWLARAYVIVAGLAIPTSNEGLNVIPHLFGSSAVGLIAVLALAWWSSRVGRASQPDADPSRTRRNQALVLNVVGVVCLLGVAAKLDDVRTVYPADDYYSTAPDGPGVLTAADGKQIQNLYAFGLDGKPLDGVLIYDQDGRPVDATEVWDEVTGSQLIPVFPRTEAGTEVRNRYPTVFQTISPDGSGTGVATTPSRPNLAVPVLEDDADVTTTTAPKATTTTAPKPTTTTAPPATTTTR